MDNELTLSQFVSNSSHYVTNNTALIFSPGNYNLESELIVESVHSFSMFAYRSVASSKAVITCGHNARFEFRNVSIVTVSGLEFVRCFENHVLSVDQFQLENSEFFSNGQPLVNGTVLSIEESVANLDRVMFLSALDVPPDIANCTDSETIVLTAKKVIGILLKRSNISITQSWFEGNKVGPGAIIYDEFGSNNITIFNSTFVNNSAQLNANTYCYGNVSIVYTSSRGSTIQVHDSKFVQNIGVLIIGHNQDMLFAHTKFINNKNWGVIYEFSVVVYVTHTNLTISHSMFINNNGVELIQALNGVITSIDHSKFISNTGSSILNASNVSMVSVTRSEFVDNTATYSPILFLDGIMIAVSLSTFINNIAGDAVVIIRYYTSPENLTNNMFSDNSAAYEVYIDTACRPGLGPSLGSSRCIQCSENWYQDLIGIIVVAFIVGIALVIFMLALNMTVAVGTLNGILFYASVVATNAKNSFLPFKTPDFVFISWLNLDIGFDVCFINAKSNTEIQVSKALLQLAFPAYVIFLVIIVIVASECSSKFAKIIGKGNPVAVLATLILLSYAKFFNATLTSFFLLYSQPAHGSRNLDITRLRNVLTQDVEQSNNLDLKAAAYFLLIFSIFILISCIIFTTLAFSWQWLLQYQDKAIFKWVRYQKLCLFLEPYHAPYTAKYRYWAGLLLLVRALLYLISLLNFSLDPRVDLLAISLIVGGLIFLKGMTAKRVYKNWPLDVMETAIYFNLVVFSALTWYNLDFGGNQVAIAYISVMIIFILLLGVIVFHIFRYTRLYKLSLVEKTFQWISSKLLDEKLEQEPLLKDAPEELDGYQLERSAAGDLELPAITHSVVEINQPAHNTD